MLKMILEGVIIFGGIWVVVTQIIGPMFFNLPLFPIFNRRITKVGDKIEKVHEDAAVLGLEKMLLDAQNKLKQDKSDIKNK